MTGDSNVVLELRHASLRSSKIEGHEGRTGYLHLQVKNVDEVEEKLDDIIKRSRMQYDNRRKLLGLGTIDSVAIMY